MLCSSGKADICEKHQVTSVASVDKTLHIYTRVSTVAQADQGTSLDTQRELGVKKAAELGFDSRLWNEGGRSSHHENIADRPQLNALYLEMKSGKVKHLWVYDQSRLSRNDQVASAFRYECSKQGVTLYTKDGVFDLASPNDNLLKQILDALAEFENATRTERSRLGKLKRVRSGSWHGGPPPFGYKLDSHKLVIVEDEAKWVRRIFNEIVKGSSVLNIKQILDSNGVSTRRKKGLWTFGSISALLKNTHYAGYYVYLDGKTEEKIEVQCPKILSDDVWKAVQHKRSSEVLRQSQKNATEKNFYLFRDLMFCAHCGRPISGRINKTRCEASYYCPNKEREWRDNGGAEEPWKRGLGCGFSRAMNIPQTDQLLWNLVKSLHKKSSTLKEEVKHRILKESGIKIKSNAEIRAIQARIRKLQRDYQSVSETLGNLEANRLIGQITDGSYDITVTRIREALGKLEVDLAKSRLELVGTAESKKWVDWLKAFGDEVDSLDALTPQKRKEYVNGLVERISVQYDAEAREHHLTLKFFLPIINDGIKYTKQGQEAKVYEIVPGEDTTTVVSKKKDGRG